MKVLIFGGTGEARELADLLTADGHEVLTSLAGKTLEPLLPKGDVRIGGYGDVPRLRAFITENGFDLVVDATHPFAETMSANLAFVMGQLAENGVHFIRLVRPQWDKPEGAKWVDLNSADEAAKHVSENAIVLDTTGQGAIANLDFPASCKRLIRLIEKPEKPLPKNARLILDRPPYTLNGETMLMREYGVTHLLAKNSGGDQTRAKIDAAVKLGVTILMVRRPALPPVACEVETVADALSHIQSLTA